ncbi:MAG TPA: NAD(P)-dependent oxidoreductase [Candidatus Acidoferrales bacterium]|nr:NAD(P)-dependent oxidoreductase [Candidatus Acidoferrales bacterium]
MALFPMFLKLEERRVLVVGGGRVGEAKIRSLLETGARVKVVAPRATARVQAWARACWDASAKSCFRNRSISQAGGGNCSAWRGKFHWGGDYERQSGSGWRRSGRSRADDGEGGGSA